MTASRWGALVAGCLLSLAVDLALFTFDDTCPQWEDEGPMAAPGSPYSLVMCGPGVEPPWVWAWYAGIPVAAGLVWLAVRRARRARAAAPWLVLALLAPSLLIGLLHLTLPRDCLSGRTASGDCSRDREAR